MLSHYALCATCPDAIAYDVSVYTIVPDSLLRTACMVCPAVATSPSHFVRLVTAQAFVLKALGGSVVLKALPVQWLGALLSHRKKSPGLIAQSQSPSGNSELDDADESDSGPAAPSEGDGGSESEGSDEKALQARAPKFASAVMESDVKAAVGKELLAVSPSTIQVPCGTMAALLPVRALPFGLFAVVEGCKVLCCDPWPFVTCAVQANMVWELVRRQSGAGGCEARRQHRGGGGDLAEAGGQSRPLHCARLEDRCVWCLCVCARANLSVLLNTAAIPGTEYTAIVMPRLVPFHDVMVMTPKRVIPIVKRLFQVTMITF